MYSLFTHSYDSEIECFYDDTIPSSEYKVISPVLNKEVGNAGSLSFVLPPNNILYDDISRTQSEIICYKSDKEVFRGRILSDKPDFYNQRSIVCEGELTYLADTVLGSGTYGTESSPISYSEFIRRILSVHNTKNTNPDDNTSFIGPYDKRFYMGYWPIANAGSNAFTTKDENVLEIIQSIAKDFELYPKITWADRGSGLKRYLDFERAFQATIPNYLGITTTEIIANVTTSPGVIINGVSKIAVANDSVTYNDNKFVYDGYIWREYVENKGRYFNQTINQQIIFGENLLNFVKTYDPTQIVTAVNMRGSRKDTSDGSEEYYDLSTSGELIDEDIIHPTNMLYIYNKTAVTNFGWREIVMEIETEDSSTQATDQLWTVGKNYLRVSQFESLTMEVTAADLTMLGVDTDEFDIFYDVEVISDPHGLDRYFPIMSMNIPLDNPGSSSYKLGASDDISLTGISQRGNQEFYEMIKALPTEKTILNAAKENASQIIKGAMTGYITIRQNAQGQSDAIIISQDADWEHSSRGMWVWNSGGLGYFPDGWNGTTTPNNAMTSDGAIVADCITAGTLMASLIHGDNIILKEQIDGVYVALNSEAFNGFDRNGNMIMTMRPHINTSSGENLSLFRSQIDCFECDDIWVGDIATQTIDGKKVLVAAGNSVVAYGGNEHTNHTFNTNPSMKVWKVELGAHTLYFSRGLLVLDEEYKESGTTIDGYTGNLTLDGQRLYFKNGILLDKTDNT